MFGVRLTIIDSKREQVIRRMGDFDTCEQQRVLGQDKIFLSITYLYPIGEVRRLLLTCFHSNTKWKG